ncbi:MAG: hypothetical protein WCJ74_03575 [bacterium]
MKKTKILLASLFISVFFFSIILVGKAEAQSGNAIWDATAQQQTPTNTGNSNYFQNYQSGPFYQTGPTQPIQSYDFSGPNPQQPGYYPTSAELYGTTNLNNTNVSNPNIMLGDNGNIGSSGGDYTGSSGSGSSGSGSSGASDSAAYQAELKKLYTGYASSTPGNQGPGGAAIGACIGSFVGSWVAGAVSGGLASIVPKDPAEIAATLFNVPTNDFQTKKANFRDETLNGLAFCIGNGLINAMSDSIVQWINRGFKNPDGTSGPGFLSNPGQFFKQIADQAVGGFFQGLGPIGNIVCKPFDLKIRLALLNQYNGNGQQLCTLTSIKQNFARFGQNGNYMGNWFQLTQQDQNNAMGSYFIAREKMAKALEYDVNKNKMEVDLGKGFLDLKKCKTYSTTIKDPNTGKAKCDVWEHTTPGAEVQASLDRAMGSKTHRLEIATNFNQIVSALVNQIVIQIMSGLSGGMNSGGSGSKKNNFGNNYDYNYTGVTDTGAPMSTTTSTTTATSTFDSGLGL